MTTPLNIGIAGLGTVGAGVVRLLNDNAALVTRRAGRVIRVVAVSARDRTRDRGIDLAGADWVDAPEQLAHHTGVDVVVELIGGAEGPAKALAAASIAAKRPFITANKAMLAAHGMALARAAEAASVPLKYEAAVAGGLPVIKGLREGAAANRITQISGILNGTCNYILSTMEATGREFADVLAEAQHLGYAEADPSFDIDGIDAAHKLSILACLAFGTRIDCAAVSTNGIRAVDACDIAQANALGFCIRLIGQAAYDAGGLYQAVRPMLVPLDHPLAHVKGAINAVTVDADPVGQLQFEGPGAGAGPTASAVVADLIDLARGSNGAPFGMPVAALEAAAPADPGARIARSYVRFAVEDKPGVLAEITAAMRDCAVSIETLIQRGEAPGGGVLVVMTTHEGPEGAVARALAQLGQSSALTSPPLVLPILG
ncbi:MAG: homoserine dehydrogenase [Alphaproteobacteria bacterium]|nr:homoserine dehydrogenase [Alphaproteobacteria bacterium]MDE2041594.1 homoserine dehydrogenase [Alphaproteobacteria bacterium]MDE2340222.1 homoserine dehydrogenase [Alphaproteobacteria bacterium]